MKFGAEALTDDEIQAAIDGARSAFARVAEAVLPQVRLMVAARLCPTPAQLDAVDEITQEVMLALTTGLPRLESRTVSGLRAYLSGIVAHKVAGVIRQRPTGTPAAQQIRSLDTTIASLSRAQPLWEFLSAGGTSLLSACAATELTERLLRKLGGLKTEYREIITHAFFDQLSMGEIARRNGTSRPAASMLLIRAVRALRGAMSSPDHDIPGNDAIA